MLTFSCVLALLLCQADGANLQETHARPNVVLILADDLGYGDLGCYGQKKIRTPNIDKLSSQGIRFLQHYSGAPVCAPARCVLMTGLHTGRAQIRGNKSVNLSQGDPIGIGQLSIREDTQTLAKAFQRAGYKTGAMGKWGLGPVVSPGAPHKQGFDLFFGYNCQGVAHSYFPPYLWRNDELIAINETPIPGHKKQPEGEVRLEEWIGQNYAPDLMVQEAVKFLESSKDKPFFLYLPFIQPHLALHPPKELVESYPEEWDQSPYRGENGYLPHPRPRAAYAALITDLDQKVGTVLDKLEELGLAENTLVIFTSDNGATHRANNDSPFGVGGVDTKFFESTAGLRGYKGSVHEGGIRVPLIVRWPGRVKPGTSSNYPSYLADFFPTLSAACGLSAPEELSGLNLVPVWTDQKELPERNPMVWVFPEYGGQVAVRIGERKAVRANLKRKNPGEWEVYDLKNDPGETKNLAAEQPDFVDQVKGILRTEMLENEQFPVEVPGVNSPLQEGKDNNSPEAKTKENSSILFQEMFENPELLLREWYDGDKFLISKESPREGNGSIEYAWKEKSTNPRSSTGIRRLFPETEKIYVGFWIRLSKGWKWSGRNYYPHLMHFLTNEIVVFSPLTGNSTSISSPPTSAMVCSPRHKPYGSIH